MIAVLDVGGSSIKSGLVDGGQPVGEVTHTPLDHTADRDEIVARFVAATASLPATDRVVLAIPEPFDYERGVSLMTHKFASLYGVDLASEISAALPRRPVVRCCNDAAAAVVGEAVAGAAVGHDRVLGVTLGTGLGAAFVVDGRPVAECAGIVVGDLYRRQLADGRVADDALSARGYLAAIDSGTTRPTEFGSLLAEFLRPVVATLGAEIVVVGGGGTGSIADFGPALRAGLAVPVEPARLDRWAPIIGGAAICFG